MYAFYTTAELEYQKLNYLKEMIICIIKKNVKILACGEKKEQQAKLHLKHTESKEIIDLSTQITCAIMVKGDDAV